jgi:hypothetical protein
MKKEIQVTEGMSKERHEIFDRIQLLGQRGVRKAIERAHAAGLSVPFSKGGKIFYHRPDGSITDKDPDEYLTKKVADSEGFALMVAENETEYKDSE